MVKPSYFAIAVASVSVIALGGVGMGMASAATTTSGTIGTSGIPRSVFREERLQATAEVLNTSTSNVQAAHKNKTFKQLITNAGLTQKTFAQKLKAQFTTDLESKGYTQDQVTIALQHRTIARLRHHDKV